MSLIISDKRLIDNNKDETNTNIHNIINHIDTITKDGLELKKGIEVRMWSWLFQLWPSESDGRWYQILPMQSGNRVSFQGIQK